MCVHLFWRAFFVCVLCVCEHRFELEPDVSLARVVERCPFTFTGADFYALSSEAFLVAIRDSIEQLESMQRCESNASAATSLAPSQCVDASSTNGWCPVLCQCAQPSSLMNACSFVFTFFLPPLLFPLAPPPPSLFSPLSLSHCSPLSLSSRSLMHTATCLRLLTLTVLFPSSIFAHHTHSPPSGCG
jgi:SpoVK/Ycf46/Vps4 family AAA+-type ATPase